MRALLHDIVIEQGVDFRLPLRFLGPSGPIDVTGYTAASQIRLAHGATPVLLSFSSDPAASSQTRILLGGAAGTVILEADADATRALNFRQGVYDVEITAPDGGLYRLAEGRVLLSREVTV